jgi:hypothetical protein
MFATWSDWDIAYTSKGLAKRRITKFLRILAVLGTIFGAIRLRRSGLGKDDLKAVLKSYVRTALLTSAGILQIAGSKV